MELEIFERRLKEGGELEELLGKTAKGYGRLYFLLRMHG